MTVYEKLYKNDDRLLIKALSEYLACYTDCEDCPIAKLCTHDNAMKCYERFEMWLQKEEGAE